MYFGLLRLSASQSIHSTPTYGYFTARSVRTGAVLQSCRAGHNSRSTAGHCLVGCVLVFSCFFETLRVLKYWQSISFLRNLYPDFEFSTEVEEQMFEDLDQTGNLQQTLTAAFV